jgi:hypothetical protein
MTIRFSELSAPRQALIRRCQQLGFGTIRNLEVFDREPMFSPGVEVLFDVKLDSDKTSRPEQNLSDFVVCGEIRRLFKLLDTVGDGTIEHIEVRAGIPRRVLFSAESSLSTKPQASGRRE